MNRLLCMYLCLLWATFHIHPLEATAQDTTTFFIESFDGVTPPDLPAGWSDPDGAWETNASVSSTGSGLNNLRIAGAGAGVVQTGAIDLSGMTSGNLQYLARRTSSYDRDSLLVWASANGGASFDVLLLDRGEALPLADGAYELITVPLPGELLGGADVRLAFEGLGGSTSGSNLRIDDVEILGTGEPAATESVLGFGADSSSATAGVFEVPLVLDFANVEALQGIQIDITWDAGQFSLSDVLRGIAIADTAAWQLNYGSRDGELRMVLLGEPASALTTGSFDPLMTLQYTVDAGNTASSATLTLAGVIGALAVRTGDDAGLNIGLSTHTVTLATGAPVFSPDATNLDFGTTPVATPAETVLTVNNTGDADLVISTVESSNALFTVSPASASILPGNATQFTVTFLPAFEVFGYQAADLTFTHNAAGGNDVITLAGIGTGGQGDVSEDGLVDVGDLVLGIDYVLETQIPAAGPFNSADVFPYASPDSLLDVRDLTVLSQAILLGVWPDDVPLPSMPPVGKDASKQQGIAVVLEPVEVDGKTVLYLDVKLPIRGFQFSVVPGDVDDVRAESALQVAHGVQPQVYFSEKAQLNVLGANMAGGVIPPGRYPVVTWARTGMNGNEATLLYGLAISADGGRYDITLGTAVGVATDVPGAGFTLGQVYPNPLTTRSSDPLQIPFESGETLDLRVEIFDVLGRRVTELAHRTFAAGQHVLSWDGKDTRGLPAAPGLYFLTIKSASVEAARTFLVR